MCHLSVFWHNCDHLVPMTLSCPFHDLRSHPQDPTSTALIGHPCPLCQQQQQQQTPYQPPTLLTAQTLSTVLGIEPNQPGFLEMMARFYARGDHKQFSPSDNTNRNRQDQPHEAGSVPNSDVPGSEWDIALAEYQNPFQQFQGQTPGPERNPELELDPPTADFYFYSAGAKSGLGFAPPKEVIDPRSDDMDPGSDLNLDLDLDLDLTPDGNWNCDWSLSPTPTTPTPIRQPVPRNHYQGSAPRFLAANHRQPTATTATNPFAGPAPRDAQLPRAPHATIMRRMRYKRNGKQRQEMVTIGKLPMAHDQRRSRREKR